MWNMFKTFNKLSTVKIVIKQRKNIVINNFHFNNNKKSIKIIIYEKKYQNKVGGFLK